MIPTVAEERAMQLRREIPEAAAKLPTRWRQNGPILSLVFFVLTSIGVAAMYAFFALGDFLEGWITFAICIALAEFLILRQRFFGTGVESALWIGGLFAMILGLPGQSRPEALLLFAAAAALAGLRLRNPWFGAISCAFVINYFAARDLDVWGFGLSMALAVTALFLLARTWKRPSTEQLFVLILLSAPVVGAMVGFRYLSTDLALPYLAFTVICFAAGIVLRHHAPLLAGFVGVALTVIAARNLLPWTVEWQLIAGGALLLIVAAAITRLLRDRTSGIVATPSDLTQYDEALQIGATIALTPTAPAASATQRPAGGSFGGAGATGEF